MSGTIEGGRKAAAKNKLKYGENFYKNIGARGGSVSCAKGFALNPYLARMAGAKGGRISRRGGGQCIYFTEVDGETVSGSLRDLADILGCAITTVYNHAKKGTPFNGHIITKQRVNK